MTGLALILVGAGALARRGVPGLVTSRGSTARERIAAALMGQIQVYAYVLLMVSDLFASLSLVKGGP